MKSLTTKQHVLTAFLIALSPGLAFAGSSSRDCQTSNKSIVMGAGNSSNQIQIKISVNGKPTVYEAPVAIMPELDYNTERTDRTVSAIPISNEKSLSRSHKRMHVVHKDGSSCDGRESWDDQSVQSYVLTGPNGKALTIGYGFDPKVEALSHLAGMNKDGYLTARFTCHTYGITTAGGCYADDEGDQITWSEIAD
jgi:hypothetical protein